MSDGSEPNLRTPLQVVVKTITTHAFAIGSYAYAINLLHRPARSHTQAFRVLFFLFVPTLPLAELLVSTIRSVLQFVRNYEDDDAVYFRFYLAAALGMHANRSQDDDNKDAKNQTLPLLNVGSHCAEKHLSPIDWIWVGKLLAALFALTQAIGTIVMWARRMNYDGLGDALALDHRNGAMGIASTICSCICILTIALRLNWKVSKAFEVENEGRGFWGSMDQPGRFIFDALFSMLIHLMIATIANSDNIWLYTSVGLVSFTLSGGGHILLQGWQSILLVIFLIVFRREIARRIGITDELYERFLGGKRQRRITILLAVLISVWMITDILMLFVADIKEIISLSGDESRYWAQDPLSDSLIVI